MIDINLLYMLPGTMRDWVKSLGPVENIKDVELSRDCIALESDGGRKSYIPNGYVKLKITIPPLEHCCTFAQIHPGEWARVYENTDMSVSRANYEAPEYMYKAPPLELNDNDAFDLMDSIRDELWS